jgi:hypothetical protein
MKVSKFLKTTIGRKRLLLEVIKTFQREKEDWIFALKYEKICKKTECS